MDHPPQPPTPADAPYPAPTRGFAVASVSLGFFSNLVFWWKPFGMVLAVVGLVLGTLSLAFKNKGGLRGENLALAGTLLCGVSLTVTAALYFALGTVQWDYVPKPF